MLIHTETTPNPDSLKFIPGTTVLEGRTLHFSNIDEAKNSPLAMRLFGVDGVKMVYLGEDFVSCTKSESFEWETLKPFIIEALLAHFTSHDPVLADASQAEIIEEFFDEKDAALVAQIKELLETRIRPAVAQDGGDIIFKGYDEGVVYLGLRGSCAGCPSSTATLKSGIENMLKHYMPEIVEVRSAPLDL
jgi:Fe-S cluster biogenesis protein NfuA